MVSHLARPRNPEVLCILQRLFRIDWLRIRAVRRPIREGEPYAFTFPYREVRHRLQVFTMHCDTRMQPGEVGPCDGAFSIIDSSHPWHGSAIVETQGKLHPQCKLSSNTLHDANHIGVPLADGHEVDESNDPIRMVESCFKNEGVVAISARGCPGTIRRKYPPQSVFLRSKERCKACFR